MEAHDGDELGGAIVSDRSLRQLADAFLDQLANPRTRRAYGFAVERVVADVGPDTRMSSVTGEELAEVLEEAWGGAAINTWNLRRAGVSSWLTWCRRHGEVAPELPVSVKAERPPVLPSKARSRTAIDRLISRRDVALREKTLWRMLYETAARSSEILDLNIEDLNLTGRSALVGGKGARTRRRGSALREDAVLEPIVWDAGTARLLPRLLAGRTRGPVFLTERPPKPSRARTARDVDPESGHVRLSYDRAAALLHAATVNAQGEGWNLHELRHSALTHLGEAGASLPLLMMKSRHRNIASLRTYVRPGTTALEELTALLGPRE